jgi:hypothetical protein
VKGEDFVFASCRFGFCFCFVAGVFDMEFVCFAEVRKV